MSFLCHSLQWQPEVERHSPGTPYILVGTKCDLISKDHHLQKTVQNKAQAVAKKIKALSYVQCSALQREGLEEVFSEVIRAILDPPEENDSNEEETDRDKASCAIS